MPDNTSQRYATMLINSSGGVYGLRHVETILQAVVMAAAEVGGKWVGAIIYKVGPAPNDVVAVVGEIPERFDGKQNMRFSQENR